MLGGWLTPKSRDAQTARAYYYGKLLILLTTVLVLVVLLYNTLVRSWDVPLIAAAVIRYDAAIFPNAYALEDMERLGQANPDNIYFQSSVGHAELTRAGFEQYLRTRLDEKPGGPDNDVMLVYLSTRRRGRQRPAVPAAFGR